jgi:hypothetical protein
MNRVRDIRDYQLLADVRRRRGLSLQEALREARTEHEHQTARQAECEAGWRECVGRHESYVVSVRCRTEAGHPVKLTELDAARRHSLVLHGEAESQRETCRQAEAAVAVAAEKQAHAGRLVAANEVRVQSLVDQVAGWRQAAASEADDREEDERGDTGGVRSPA